MKKILLKNHGVNYSDGISFYPYSLYIALVNDHSDADVELDIFELYNKLTELKCPDIIFMGGKQYVEELSWLLPKLLADRIYLSSMCTIDTILPLPFNRGLIVTDFQGIKRRTEKFISLGDNDIVILRTESAKEVFMVKNVFINNKIRAGLAYDGIMLDASDLIKEKVYEVAPYSGLII